MVIKNIPPLRLLLFFALTANPVMAFVPAGTNAEDSRWLTTAMGDTGQAGDPISLTWSFVSDGTLVNNLGTPAGQEPSDLIAELDAAFGEGPGGSDLTLRPWFTFFEQSFTRIGELAGVTYIYEPNDLGQVAHGTLSGEIGLRGDVRIGGIDLDGAGGTLAYNYFASAGGDMAIDTSDLQGLSTEVSNNFREMRNLIMHEAGHGLGLDHTVSGDANFLMEPVINIDFDGPQHDDLRGFHWMYGDVYEKSLGGRNDSVGSATPLGELISNGSLSIGTGGSNWTVDAGETDFVSISNQNDVDFFSFVTAEPLLLDIAMTPRGASYDQNGQPFETTSTSDLSLAVFDRDGTTMIAEAELAAIGEAESITSLLLHEPGTYFARVRGPVTTSLQVTQFYQLDLSANEVLPGDYNFNQIVEGGDFLAWQRGESPNPFSSSDLATWEANYDLQSTVYAATVPEPEAFLLALAGLGFGLFRYRS